MPGTLSPLDMSGITIPFHFRCPISLELMRDPVTISTGQTFDRPSIESWVASGHSTCPVTRSTLTDFTLIPNHTLRRLIQHWCVSHRNLGVERIPTPKQPADPSLLQSLLLSASSSSPGIQIPALRRLADLARESDKNRALIASSAELRETLIDIAFKFAHSGGYMDSTADINTSAETGFLDNYDGSSIEAMAVLSLIPLTESDSTAVISRKERLQRLGDVVSRHPSVEARMDAAAVIEAVATTARSPEARVAVGETNGVIEGLVWLVMNGNCRGVRVGIRGLFSLCLAKENRGLVVAAGAAAAVVRRIGELGGGDAERALAMVELICRTESGREAVVEGWGGGPNAVAALVRAMAGKSSERAAEHAAGALVAVVGGAEAQEELQRVAVAAGVVPQLLVMVQGGCSERAKRKAQLLLKLLRSAWPRYDSMANSDDFVQAY